MPETMLDREFVEKALLPTCHAPSLGRWPFAPYEGRPPDALASSSERRVNMARDSRPAAFVLAVLKSRWMARL